MSREAKSLEPQLMIFTHTECIAASVGRAFNHVCLSALK